MKAFQCSFLLWPVWKQINLIGYFEKTLGRNQGESLPIFSSFVTCLETNKFCQVFWKDTWSPSRWKPFNFPFFWGLCGNKWTWYSILKRHLVAIQVKAFQFSVLLWPVWKQINLIEYFEKTLGCHFFFILWPVWKQINLVEYFEKTLGRYQGESLSIFLSIEASVETNELGKVFWKGT